MNISFITIGDKSFYKTINISINQARNLYPEAHITGLKEGLISQRTGSCISKARVTETNILISYFRS